MLVQARRSAKVVDASISLKARRRFELLEQRTVLASITFPTEHMIDEGLRAAQHVLGADIDADGDFDVVAATPTFEGGRRISWYQNGDGLGHFGDPILIAEERGVETWQLLMLDLDEDLDQDIVELDRWKGITWFKNLDGLGYFSAPRTLLEGKILAMDLGDLDGDGDLDLAVFRTDRRDNLWVYLNEDGHWSLDSGTPLGRFDSYDHSAVAIADWNGDGLLDVTCSGNPISVDADFVWHENLGTGTSFLLRETPVERMITKLLEPFDVDQDGDLDLVVGGLGYYYLAWLENSDGAGSFTATHRIAFTEGPRVDIMVADLDRDGDPDFLTADVESPRIEWYENVQDGLVISRSMPVSTADRDGWDVTAADMDGDGDLDVVFGADEGIYWQENRLIGDSNDDGVFDSSDITFVFQVGKYEDDLPGNATFDEGDWNLDGDFDSSDFVLAFQAGHYTPATPSKRAQVAAAIDWLFAHDRRAPRQRADEA